MRTVTKDVILLCKGWYDKEKYPTILEALKQYYRQYYNDDMEDCLCEKFLFDTILIGVMREIATDYPDRLRYFMECLVETNRWFCHIPNESNTDYDYQLFYRVVSFLSQVKMRGDGVKEIDTGEYFVKEFQDDVRSVSTGQFLWYEGKKRLVKDII